MDAKQLIKELQTIPKFIKDLEEERHAILSLISSSHSYSDTRSADQQNKCTGS